VLHRLLCLLGVHVLEVVAPPGKPADFRHPMRPNSIYFYHRCKVCGAVAR
jgi:hypothetical protein